VSTKLQRNNTDRVGTASVKESKLIETASTVGATGRLIRRSIRSCESRCTTKRSTPRSFSRNSGSARSSASANYQSQSRVFAARARNWLEKLDSLRTRERTVERETTTMMTTRTRTRTRTRTTTTTTTTRRRLGSSRPSPLHSSPPLSNRPPPGLLATTSSRRRWRLHTTSNRFTADNALFEIAESLDVSMSAATHFLSLFLPSVFLPILPLPWDGALTLSRKRRDCERTSDDDRGSLGLSVFHFAPLPFSSPARGMCVSLSSSSALVRAPSS